MDASGGEPALKVAVDGALEALSPEQESLLLERAPARARELEKRVREIVESVREEGDAALLRMARELDDVALPSLEVPQDRWKEALQELDPLLRKALERAARNLEGFHRAQIPPPVDFTSEPGVRMGRRTVPLDGVGVYAPGGLASYPSSVLMGVVPARTAGVKEIAVCSPPGPDGEPPAEVLAACAVAGATRLFAVGGAGAVAALAYGTETIPQVQAVVGPGNRWVTEGKRQVAGTVRVDAPAGPSEVLVVAGTGADPRRVAAELVAQAEHDPEAAVAAVAWDRELLDRIRAVLAEEVESTPRRETVEEAIGSRGALLLARDREEALDFARRYAPEHLALYTSAPRADLEAVPTAGTAFLGEASSVAYGDYLTGANHVLPTAGAGRAFSGLSVLDFLRFYTWQELDEDGAAAMTDDVVRLAEAEGLPAHGRAARLRAPGEPTEVEPGGEERPPSGGSQNTGPAKETS